METRTIILSLIALFLCLFIGNILFGQSSADSSPHGSPYFQAISELDELSTFPGGVEQMSNNFSKNLPHSVATHENAKIPEPVILDMEVMRKY